MTPKEKMQRTSVLISVLLRNKRIVDTGSDLLCTELIEHWIKHGTVTPAGVGGYDLTESGESDAKITQQFIIWFLEEE